LEAFVSNLFRINSRDTVKPTFAFTRSVAESVAHDYRRRFALGEISEVEDDAYGIDAGGMAIVGMPVHTINLYPGLEFSFAGHQASWALGRVEKALADERAGGYVKVHGKWSCLCLPTVMARDLLRSMTPLVERAETEADAFIADHFKKIGRP
jgi:hypothetical protein